MADPILWKRQLQSSLPPYEHPDVDYDYYDVVVGQMVSVAADAITTTPAGPRSNPPTMSVAVLTLIIVASLSAVVGAIYLLIYFKSIKPMSARSRSYADPGGGKGDDEGPRKSAGHPFFRRK